MLENSKAYSGIGIDDVESAKRFYGETLEQQVEVLDEEHGLLQMHLAGERPTLLYRSPGMSPASYTVLNFPVAEIEAAVDHLVARGVVFERYEGFDHDENGIVRGNGRGPDIAWFKDPSGNVLSVHSDPGA
ncbi:MAG TPA: VOC family protein [Solirubrobacterales bacterium]|jgi:predicted enzyme related to lactoylglutathione lyase